MVENAKKNKQIATKIAPKFAPKIVPNAVCAKLLLEIVVMLRSIFSLLDWPSALVWNNDSEAEMSILVPSQGIHWKIASGHNFGMPWVK